MTDQRPDEDSTVRLTVPEAASMVQSLQPGGMTITEVTALVQLFNNQLSAMEGRLVAKMDDNSRLASERWAKHDQELDANTKRVVDRFEKLERTLLTVETSLKEHLDREHEEDVASDARIRPIKGSIAWFWKNWRDVVLLIIGIIALGTFLVETYGRAIGPHAP